MFLPHPPRGSVLGLRPPGLRFRILCLEDSVISFISPSSGCSPAQFSLYVHKVGLKPDSLYFTWTLSLSRLTDKWSANPESMDRLPRWDILTLTALNIFCINHGDQRILSNSNHHKFLSLSVAVRGSTLGVRIDVWAQGISIYLEFHQTFLNLV